MAVLKLKTSSPPRMPLYIFCDSDLLAARLRSSNIDGALHTDTELARIVSQIRERWPDVKIILRGDRGFAREWLVAWCVSLFCRPPKGTEGASRSMRAISTVSRAAGS